MTFFGFFVCITGNGHFFCIMIDTLLSCFYHKSLLLLGLMESITAHKSSHVTHVFCLLFESIKILEVMRCYLLLSKT